MADDPDFDKFLKELDDLKGQAPLFKPRNGLTERIMSVVQREERELREKRLKGLATPLAVAATLVAAWFFFSRAF